MRIPKYRLHKPTGQSLVEWKGKRHYLGKHGTPASKKAYRDFVRLVVSEQPVRPVPTLAPGETATIGDLLMAYLTWAENYYGSLEFDNMRYAVRPLKAIHGETPIDDFGPVELKQVRDEMVRRGWVRTHINAQVGRIRRVFNWGVENGIVPPGTAHLLRSVPPLKPGRSSANVKEGKKVEPIANEHVDAILPYLSAPVAAMVQIQRLTGMRSDNLCSLRPREIDMAGDVWVYQPPKHKASLRGRSLFIAIGPAGQAVLGPWLEGKQPDEFVFSPAESVTWHNERRAERRVTKRYGVSTATKSKRRPKRLKKKLPGKRYGTRSYRRAVIYGIEAANREIVAAAAKDGIEKPNTIPAWTPHQLRHSRGTAVRVRHGLEGAQVALGHSTANVTQLYAERDLTLAVRIARDMG